MEVSKVVLQQPEFFHFGGVQIIKKIFGAGRKAGAGRKDESKVKREIHFLKEKKFERQKAASAIDKLIEEVHLMIDYIHSRDVMFPVSTSGGPMLKEVRRVLHILADEVKKGYFEPRRFVDAFEGLGSSLSMEKNPEYKARIYRMRLQLDDISRKLKRLTLYKEEI
ncbi:MAG: hypothetical protein AB1305_03745 [Candidatus Hadarchaeota archaeon]